MITGDEKLSKSAEKFLPLLKNKLPDLQQYVKVVLPSTDNPYVTPNSIIIVIPARKGFLFEKLYIETRPNDILIEMGVARDMQYAWISSWNPEYIENVMLRALQFIYDILNEKIIFVKRKALFSSKEFYEYIQKKELRRKKRVIAVYSWKGTYDKKEE